MSRSAAQLPLILLAAGALSGSHLAAAVAGGPDDVGPRGVFKPGQTSIGPDSLSTASSLSEESEVKSQSMQLKSIQHASKIHSHNAEGRTAESTYRALKQKMRSTEGDCMALNAQGPDKFYTYTPELRAAAQAKLAKEASAQVTPEVSSMLQASVSASATTAGNQTTQTGEGNGGMAANIVGVGNYDSEHGAVHVGVSVVGGTCLANKPIRMCWCSRGVYLHVDDWHYKVTSIMRKGESLCMGECRMSQILSQMVADAVTKQDPTDRTLIVQVEDIPNLPFGIIVDAHTHWADGTLEARVRFTETKQGTVLPGWVCIKCCDAAPMSLLVADEVMGCIHEINTSPKNYAVSRSIGLNPSTYRMVQLGSRTYYLPNDVPDQTICLAADVRRLLMGGDAVVQVCPAMSRSEAQVAQIVRIMLGGP